MGLDGYEGHHVMFHGEPGDGCHGKYRLLMPRSTPFWIAIGTKLIQFFGGEIDFNDCDSKGMDLKRKKPRKWNDPSNGKSWQDLQKDMWGLKPIAKDDLVAAAKYASYDCGLDVVAAGVEQGPSDEQQVEDIANKMMEEA